LGSPAAPLLGGEEGAGLGGGVLRYSRTRLTRSPLLGNEQIGAGGPSLLTRRADPRAAANQQRRENPQLRSA